MFGAAFGVVSTLLAVSMGAGALMFFSLRNRWIIGSIAAILVQAFSFMIAACAGLASFFLFPFAFMGQSTSGVVVTGLGTIVLAISTAVNLFVLGWFIALALKNRSGAQGAVGNAT